MQYIKHEDGASYYFADKEMATLHRLDGPAVAHSDGYESWWLNGEYLTEAEFNEITKPQPKQPMEIQYVQIENGNTYYFSDREMTIYHREDGPAVIGTNGYTAQYINGKLHNPDGPAITWPDGCKSWVINGEEMTEAEFDALTNQPTKTETTNDTLFTEAYDTCMTCFEKQPQPTQTMTTTNSEQPPLKSAKDITSIESERDQYKAALEEIVKRPRKSETCKLIAQKALGVLNDEVYQPELLMEENLALKIKIEDLQALIDSELIDRVFPQS